jgi:hypothetical protein
MPSYPSTSSIRYETLLWNALEQHLSGALLHEGLQVSATVNYDKPLAATSFEIGVRACSSHRNDPLRNAKLVSATITARHGQRRCIMQPSIRVDEGLSLQVTKGRAGALSSPHHIACILRTSPPPTTTTSTTTPSYPQTILIMQYLAAFAVLAVSVSSAAARQITVYNNCPFTIWPAVRILIVFDHHIALIM